MFETITIIIMSALIISACIWGWWIENHGSEADDNAGDTPVKQEK